MQTYEWYEMLEKPFFAPPAWLFGPVWSVLYLIIILSFGYVAYLFLKKRISFLIVLPFILNIIFNILFSPIQFGLQNNLLAAVDILLVLATLVWALKVIWPYAKWVTFTNVPYLAWVSFATVLQLSILYLNW